MDNLAEKFDVNPENTWRLETPGATGWAGSARPSAANKYFIVSADTHITPPFTLMPERIDPKFKDRLPRVEKDADGKVWSVVDGTRPRQLIMDPLEGEDDYRAKAGGGGRIDLGEEGIAKRFADQELDGVDAEVAFPNGPAIAAYWTRDIEFSMAQFRVYNDWAAEHMSERLNIAAGIGTADIDLAIAEVERVARMGFRVVNLPCKPIFGPNDPGDLNYNHSDFDRLWAAVQDTDLTMTFHVSTGYDPRGARGMGGAVTNYVVHSTSPTIEPVCHLCASGVIERFPKLRFATIEAGIGWVAWVLDAMDEAYRKHHMWVRPKLKNLPSDYFQSNGGASFGEDRAGLLTMDDFGLSDNFFWANDYPHHEGTFPHSAEAIEREMGHLREESRRKVLGLNAARMFRFEIPERYR